jgi:hypothetical protein
MSYDKYDFDYDSMANDADDLYEDWDYDDTNDEVDEQAEWENYYHNIADEIVED